MLKRLKKLVAGPAVNPSRHYLRKWAEEAAAVGKDKSFRVLDAGAGNAPYRDLFQHVSYETADLATYEKDDYTQLDHVCDLADMPMPDDTYDMVFCSQTLEHVKYPQQVLHEIRRVLKPGGQAWLSAPFSFEEHEKPYDYFRYTRYGWEHMATEAGFEVKDIDWLEGYYGNLAYQLRVAARVLPRSMALARFVLAVMARRFAQRDLHDRITDRGMCKNYRVTLVNPS